jgi:glycosyltransferase involved in cell wall biosynthesis
MKRVDKVISKNNKNIAIDACKSDWILQLDADEIVTPELKYEIISYLKKDINEIKENGFNLISKFRIVNGTEQHWAHPVIHNGVLYVRHGNALMAFDIRKK